MKDFALKYLQKGFSVIPMIPGTPNPLVAWTPFKEKKPTEQQVIDWWTKWPTADIAAVTGAVSGITVLDIDRTVHDDPNSPLPYYGDLPETLTVESGGKGLHLYFKYSKRASLVSDGKLRNGIEIKSDKRLIRLPPSLHKSGNRYKWINKLQMADFPDTLVFDEMIKSKSNFDKSVLVGVGNGDRNNTAASIAGKLIALKTDPIVMFNFMMAWDSMNTPPLGERVIKETIASMVRTDERNHPQIKTDYQLVPFNDLLARSMDSLDLVDASECVETGYKWLDDKIVGLFKGELLVWGGESGSGKTTMVTNICYKVANRGVKTVVMALEDRLDDYGIKAVYFALGRVRKAVGKSFYSWNDYRKNQIKDSEYKLFRAKAVESLKSSNLSFVEVSAQMDIDLLEKIIVKETEKGTKLFLVDHLHYLDMTSKENASRAEFVEKMMIKIKSVLNRTGARMILVVHYKKLEGRKPMLDSFKDSISIPQNANYVVNMWRDRSEKGDQFETTFYIPKVRNPNGEATIKMKYDPTTNEYVDELENSFGTPQQVDPEVKEIASQIQL